MCILTSKITLLLMKTLPTLRDHVRSLPWCSIHSLSTGTLHNGQGDQPQDRDGRNILRWGAAVLVTSSSKLAAMMSAKVSNVDSMLICVCEYVQLKVACVLCRVFADRICYI